MNEKKWYLRTQDETFGPESGATLVQWAELGRIQPGQEVSDDNVIWTKVEEVPFLDMRFSIDIGDGNPRGPFNKVAADALVASGRLPSTAKVVETREPFADEKVEREDEGEGEGEGEEEKVKVEGEEKVKVEGEEKVKVEGEGEVKVVEKIVEVPVEKVVEKIVEVPVEKVVEKIVTIVDDTRIKELENLLAEARERADALQNKLDESSKAASDQRAELARMDGELKNAAGRASALEAKIAEAEAGYARSAQDALDREHKLNEQITTLENELRRLPQAASEVADIQASMYGLMSRESAELDAMISVEKSELEEFRKRCENRIDRLIERRREILKRSGSSIEEMTHRSLLERPEDPRTAQLRREVEDLRRMDEKKSQNATKRIRELEAELKERESEGKRVAEGLKDLTQLRQENQSLREQLQAREREIMAERERAEALRQREAASQQSMIARLKTLESPSIGTTATIATNQSREAKLVKLPGWMHFGRK